jgi:phytoene desaturase
MKQPVPGAATVVVVGAGLSGLSAAMHCAGAGHRVTLLEAQDVPGGRNGTLSQDGFRFDTGPVVFTMVNLLEQAFAAVGARVSDYVTMTQLDPAYHAFFADGSRLLVRPGHEKMRDEIRRECGSKDAVAFDSFVLWLKRLNDVELPNFIDANFDSPLGLLRSPAAGIELLRLRAFGRLGPEIARRFDDDRLRRVFSFQAMYAGLSPTRALSLYAVITYMDSIKGVYFPEGGMHAVPMAMARAAEDAGVEIRYSTQVRRVTRAYDGRAIGVVLADGERVVADVVIVTADLPVAYDRLLPGVRAPRAARNGRYSPSAVVWHVGMKNAMVPYGAGHHNIHFGQAWDDAFVDILERGRAMVDPSRYVAVPSIHDPGAAPAGHSSLYVLEPVPNLHVGRIHWETEAPAFRDRLHAFLAKSGYDGEIVTEKLVTPTDWEAQGMAAGTPFSLAHTFAQTGPFRPRNVDRRVPGLVFAGSGTTPGVGIPMVLVSGKLAADRVKGMLR